MAELTANIGQIVDCTEAEGPGRRFAIWFQGCPLRCPGCCNPELLSFDGGTPMPISRLINRVASLSSRIEGVSLLGGEPFAHAPAAAAIAVAVRQMHLTVMVYSGYKLAELGAMPDPAVANLLSNTDVLVDGPYDREQPESVRRWVGSTNQVVHLLTDRYHPDDPMWKRRNTIELRLRNGELQVNGFPTPVAAEFWRRLPRPIGGQR